MFAHDVPLLLASDVVSADPGRFPLDRIRMQKAVFLLAMRGTDRLRVYEFEPYNWGPYSGALTHDVRNLVEAQYLAADRAPGSQYPRYRTTAEGEAAAERVWGELTDTEKSFVRSVRAYVTDRSFNHLLREVYAAYPEYASKSQFNG